jgi:hypothetical protein
MWYWFSKNKNWCIGLRTWRQATGRIYLCSIYQLVFQDRPTQKLKFCFRGKQPRYDVVSVRTYIPACSSTAQVAKRNSPIFPKATRQSLTSRLQGPRAHFVVQTTYQRENPKLKKARTTQSISPSLLCNGSMHAARDHKLEVWPVWSGFAELSSCWICCSRLLIPYRWHQLRLLFSQ